MGFAWVLRGSYPFLFKNAKDINVSLPVLYVHYVHLIMFTGFKK